MNGFAEKQRERINEFGAGVTRVLVSKLYLFIKRRNAWYGVSLQHLSRHVSQHHKHMLSYVKMEGGGGSRVPYSIDSPV